MVFVLFSRRAVPVHHFPRPPPALPAHPAASSVPYLHGVYSSPHTLRFFGRASHPLVPFSSRFLAFPPSPGESPAARSPAPTMPLLPSSFFPILRHLARQPPQIEQRAQELRACCGSGGELQPSAKALSAAFNYDYARIKLLSPRVCPETHSFFFSPPEQPLPQALNNIVMIPSELGVYIVARAAMQHSARLDHARNGHCLSSEGVHALLVAASLASPARLCFGCITKTCVESALLLMEGDPWAACTAVAVSERAALWCNPALRLHIREVESIMLAADFIPLFNDAMYFQSVAAGKATVVAVPIGEAPAVIASIISTRPEGSLVPGEAAMYDVAHVGNESTRVTYACLFHKQPEPSPAPCASAAAAAAAAAAPPPPAEAASPSSVTAATAEAIAAAATNARDGRNAGAMNLHCQGRVTLLFGGRGLARITFTRCSQLHASNLCSTHYTLPPPLQLQVLAYASSGTIGAVAAPANALPQCQILLGMVRCRMSHTFTSPFRALCCHLPPQRTSHTLSLIVFSPSFMPPFTPPPSLFPLPSSARTTSRTLSSFSRAWSPPRSTARWSGMPHFPMRRWVRRTL